jgi:hypothetical protein
VKVERAWVGARGVDSLPYSQAGTLAQAVALKATGVDFFVGYLGVINKARLEYLLDAGLAFMPVTLAERYDGGDAVRHCMSLGLPPGTSVWLDLEGKAAWETPAPVLMAKINAWADAVKTGGYMPCLYVGAPQPLSGKELYALKVVRYWLGIGRCIDKTGADAYPTCGWCVRQDWHGQTNGMLWPPPHVHSDERVFVDTNSIQCDHRGRLPSWCTRTF